MTVAGLDTSLLVCLRDARHIQFSDSLLGMIESSLCHGPVYFNCYPNFTVSLTDKNILDVLTLNIQTQLYNMKEGSENIQVGYRIYYKVMTTNCPEFKTL